MEIRINIEKQHVVFLLAGFMLIIWAGLVWAGFGSVPNPGHAISELQECDTEGNILKMVGGQWQCSEDLSGGGGVSSWNDLQDIPAGFSDNIDDIGIISESDPQVSSVTSGKLCMGTGSQVSCDKNPPSLAADAYFVEGWNPFAPDGSGWQSHDQQEWKDVESVEIGVPGPGYVLVMTAGDMYTYNAENHAMAVGISESSQSAPSNGAFVEERSDHPTTSNNLGVPFAVHYVDSVSAGTYEYYVVASMDSYDGGKRMDVKGSVQALFIPWN